MQTNIIESLSRYTQSHAKNAVYATLLKIPANLKVSLGAPKASGSTEVTLIGYAGAVQFVEDPAGGIIIDLSWVDFTKVASKWAWAFKLVNVF